MSRPRRKYHAYFHQKNKNNYNLPTYNNLSPASSYVVCATCIMLQAKASILQITSTFSTSSLVWKFPFMAKTKPCLLSTLRHSFWGSWGNWKMNPGLLIWPCISIRMWWEKEVNRVLASLRSLSFSCAGKWRGPSKHSWLKINNPISYTWNNFSKTNNTLNWSNSYKPSCPSTSPHS